MRADRPARGKDNSKCVLTSVSWSNSPLNIPQVTKKVGLFGLLFTICMGENIFAYQMWWKILLNRISPWNTSVYMKEGWKINVRESYVYWTVHHLDSLVKRDQLDVTCFIISLFNAQHVSDVNTSILRSLRLYVLSMQAEALVPQPAYGYHTTTATPQRNTNTHRTRSIQPMK